MIDDFSGPGRDDAHRDSSAEPPAEAVGQLPQPQLDDRQRQSAVEAAEKEVEKALADTDDNRGDVGPAAIAIKPKKAKHKRHLWPVDWSKKKKRLATSGLILAVILLVGGGIYLWRRSQAKPVATVKVQRKVAPKPTTVPSKLTGLPVAPDLNQRPVTGVMIENSPDARPQAGLQEAGLVYEAVAEGGITRFLALYQAEQPADIGPIRSARPYYLDWLLPFDAAYAHVGGSPEALAQIKSLGVKDMDQFYNAGFYHRVSTRYAPHNVFTSMAKFDQLEKQRGYTTSKFSGFARKKEAKSVQPTATSIDLQMSGYLYNSHYDYDAASNSYKRSEGGKPHVDANSGKQISPKVVIALVMSRSLEADDYHSRYATVGGGTMYVFQDGGLTKGSWHKASRTAQFSFTDESGQTLKLNPGQTWITMVNAASDVSYKP